MRARTRLWSVVMVLSLDRAHAGRPCETRPPEAERVRLVQVVQ